MGFVLFVFFWKSATRVRTHFQELGFVVSCFKYLIKNYLGGRKKGGQSKETKSAKINHPPRSHCVSSCA